MAGRKKTAGGGKRKMGRPTKCTPELTEKIAAHVRQHVHPQVAAQLEGIHANSFIAWTNRGERGEEPYVTFCDAIARAKAHSEAELSKALAKGLHPSGVPDWKSARSLLEVLHRERWAVSQQIEHKVRHDLDDFMQRLKARLSPDTYAQVLQVYLDSLSAEDMADAAEAAGTIH